MAAENDPDHFVADIEEWLKEEQRKKDPDYRITVYCDHHLGVKMNLATSWASVESGETSADINPRLHWFCPKSDCARCYEPTMFGYHWNSGEPGSRIQMNFQRQPRGNHPGLPFMYIGKVGEGRQFMCPIYECDEHGPQVATLVVDEEVELPAPSLDDLRGSERKRALEMSIFLSFASASGLPIDEGSAESREPNYPDILCTISGERYFFELGRVINREVAEKLNPNRRKPEGGFSYNQEKPLVDIVKSKSAKAYKTEGAPVDLLLHFDLRLGSASTVERLIQSNPELLHSPATTGPFKRVWVFDEYTRQIVWKSEL
jgi:hypothetical protein